MLTLRPAAPGSGWLLAVSLALAACGGLQEPPTLPEEKGRSQAPSNAAPTLSNAQTGADDAEPATLAEAERLLEKAKQDLDRLALNEPGAPAAGAATPEPASPTAYAPPPRDAAPKSATKKRGEQESAADRAAPSPAPEKQANSCDTACKAFSSLERASAAVCRLDADGGLRCQRARQIREDAARRVASCGCAQ